ncbi:MAG: hypothetical protein KH284_07755 [Clostridiales bacterium]|nr:hypothetical protein [Clostridiales bacterium]
MKWERTIFETSDEKLSFLKNSGLLPDGSDEVRQLFYNGVQSSALTKCEIIGCYNNSVALIDVAGKEIKIASDYLKEMQPLVGRIKKVLGIDFETANGQRDSACSVGLYLKEFQLDHVICKKEILINPHCKFNGFNTYVNGITAEMVANCPDFRAAYTEICSLIDKDTLVVVHNASFDISVLRRSCERYGLTSPKLSFICTLQMARKVIPALPSYSLDYLADHLGLGEFNHHNALEDAKMCALLFDFLMDTCGCETRKQLEKKEIIFAGELDDAKAVYIPCRTNKVEGQQRSHTNRSAVSIEIHEHIDPDHPFYQKTVVFTGHLKSMTRDTAKKMIAAVGGIPGSAVTSDTNYLVCGYQDAYHLYGKDKSSKTIKAEEYAAKGYDIQIINEVDFLELL